MDPPSDSFSQYPRSSLASSPLRLTAMLFPGRCSVPGRSTGDVRGPEVDRPRCLVRGADFLLPRSRATGTVDWVSGPSQARAVSPSRASSARRRLPPTRTACMSCGLLSCPAASRMQGLCGNGVFELTKSARHVRSRQPDGTSSFQAHELSKVGRPPTAAARGARSSLRARFAYRR
jgi:hypothetical protein